MPSEYPCRSVKIAPLQQWRDYRIAYALFATEAEGRAAQEDMTRSSALLSHHAPIIDQFIDPFDHTCLTLVAYIVRKIGDNTVVVSHRMKRPGEEHPLGPLPVPSRFVTTTAKRGAGFFKPPPPSQRDNGYGSRAGK